MGEEGEKPCKGHPYSLAEGFIGTWEEYTVKGEQEILEGILHVRFEVGGCVLLQTFSSGDGGFTFMSFGQVNPETNNWLETYVFNNGRSAQWQWRNVGEEIIMERVGGDTARKVQLRIVNFTEDSYEVIEESSEDDGKNWEVIELTRTKRLAN